MKFCCGITLYNPSHKEVLNIQNYQTSFEKIYLFDNSDENKENKLLKNLINSTDFIYYYDNGNNGGLSVAFNKMCKAAIKDGFDYICLLDQDSLFEENDIEILKQAILRYQKLNPKIAVYGPNVVYSISSETNNEAAETFKPTENNIIMIDWIISSGSFINLDIYSETQGFDESYFIDRIDYDYCLSLKEKYKVCMVSNSYLYQELGETKDIFGYKFTQHSSLRTYYMQRNRCYYYLIKQFSYINFIKTLLLIIRQIAAIVVLEDDKFAKILKSYEGIYDFLKKRMGKYHERNKSPKFIVVKMLGGLGNQLFQIAFARAIALENNLKIIVDRSVYKNYKIRDYSLDHIFLSEEFAYLEHSEIPKVPLLIYYLTAPIYNVIRKILSYSSVYVKFMKLFYDILSKFGLFYYFCNLFHSTVNYKNNIFLYGYFQSEKFFKDYKEDIIKELKVKTKVTEKESGLLSRISTEKSVGISIRTGEDYTDLIVCNNSYYNEGMEYIAKRVEGATFYVFSDCIDKVKASYKFNYPVIYVEGFSDYQSLRLLYSCKHFIISNSSFSWWGAYLSENQDKFVIAPEPWMRKGHFDDIFTESMIKINV